MNIPWERVEKWQYEIDKVAFEYNRKFSMVEHEDIRQSLYQWFVEHPNKLDEWEKIGNKDAKNLIYRSLRNRALDYCQKWKAKSLGYEVQDVYYYDADVVEALLSPVLRREFNVTHKLNLGKTGGRPSAPHEGGNLMIMMIEIDSAFWKLAVEEQKLLVLRYVEAMDFEEIGKVMELGSPDAVRMRHKRLIKKLINKIGGYKPYRDYDSNEEQDEEEVSDEDVL
jgi:RNA polymerase sigma factor (sigma-70 family)